ncbi:unnamed protein product [Calypogeia fissa]
MEMEFYTFIRRFEALWLLIGEMVYIYYVVLRLKKGLPRLLALLPLFPPMFIVPWRGQTAPERTLYSFLFHWTIMSKLLLLVWDAGPAADPHVVSSFLRFFSAMTFSLHLKRDTRFISAKELEAASSAAMESRTINGAHSDASNGLTRRKPKSGMAANDMKNGESNGVSTKEDPLLDLQQRAEKKENENASFFKWVETEVNTIVNSQTGWVVLLRGVFYFIVDGVLIKTVLELRHVLPINVLNFLLAFTIYFSCLVLFELPAGICGCVLGTKLDPQFNMPFIADSLADFWGRRWNLLVNNLLRVSVYEPILAFLIRRKAEKEKPTEMLKVNAKVKVNVNEKMRIKASTVDSNRDTGGVHGVRCCA